jgi:iron complex outermembrane recepter protein
MAITYKVVPVAAVVCTLMAQAAMAQSQQIPTITVEGKTAPVLEPERASVGGFDAPLRQQAQSISVMSRDALVETSTATLSQLTRLDASLMDAYNTVGYNQSLSIRGFVLDNVYSFRREGLPVLNIGPLPFENKSQIEVLKGVSGMLAGVSAPGGLVNAALKQPAREWGSHVALSAGERGSVGVAADAGGAIGQGLAVQLNALATRMLPEVEQAQGQRQFLSAFVRYAVSPNTKLSVDGEWQRFKQPSVPGLSPLDSNGDGVGDALPTPRPRLNLNAQPWSLPFETQSNLFAVRLSHALSDAWQLHAAAQRQQVRTNDRIVFPDGCSSATTYVYPGFCGNGDYDLYDFRSEHERRVLNVVDAHLKGHTEVMGAKVVTTFGVLQRTFSQRTQDQAYNYVGTGNLFQSSVFDAAPALSSAGTNLDERSREAYTNTHVQAGSVTLFGGVRVAALHRASVRTDGTEATAVDQHLSSPSLGVSYALSSTLNAYASWGRGAESEVVPNRPKQYANYGAALPALMSAQREAGVKWQAVPRVLVTAAVFEIRKPFADDIARVDDERFDRVAGRKTATHRGVEAAVVGKLSAQWSVQLSATWLDARITNAVNTDLIGKRVTNVPKQAATALIDYQPSVMPGFGVNALVSMASRKAVTADNSLEIAGGGQLDLGVRYAHNMGGQRLTWRVNLENASNRFAWREAPTQPWGGIYLFPTPARTLRASMTIDF